jgi:trans-2,3-dihydro-3-hydroxyanthranilate isomerase
VRKLNYSIVDVFTDRPLAGNPLCVFTDGTGLTGGQMQALAREVNLSETVFVLRAEGEATARVRIFTPLRELRFAGHPLVGTAYVLGRSAPIMVARLETGVGPIDVVIERDGGFVTRCVVTQPDPVIEPYGGGEALAAGLGATLLGDVVIGDNGTRTLLVPVADVSALTPDTSALRGFGEVTICAYERPVEGTVGVRVFAPALGVEEDPATGSAAGPLAVHLLASGLIEPGRLVVRQGVEMGRPSRLEVDVEAGAPPRVGGACVAVGRGFYEVNLAAVG